MMSISPSVAIVVGIMILMTAAAINLAASEVRSRRLHLHVQRTISVGPDSPRSVFAGMSGHLQGLGELSRKFYAPASLDYLRGAIQAAGFNPHRMLPLLLGVKLALTVLILAVSISTALFIAASFLTKVAIVGAGVFLAILGPESILKIVRGRFQKSLIRGTPDALDLLVVCSEAGMGLESALERVAQEMEATNGPMASVLFGLLNDLRVLPNRRDAFTNLGVRSGVDGLRRMGTMLSQSMQYGTPIGHVLRAVAEELRRDRMNRLEEMAIKLPAKLIFPLIFFIMPSMYIVLLGPSFMGMFKTLAVMIHTFN
jgi:tight adherence protein C